MVMAASTSVGSSGQKSSKFSDLRGVNRETSSCEKAGRAIERAMFSHPSASSTRWNLRFIPFATIAPRLARAAMDYASVHGGADRHLP
jgi:hypothetical protein